jgi:hypothetical protein
LGAAALVGEGLGLGFLLFVGVGDGLGLELLEGDGLGLELLAVFEGDGLGLVVDALLDAAGELDAEVLGVTLLDDGLALEPAIAAVSSAAVTVCVEAVVFEVPAFLTE